MSTHADQPRDKESGRHGRLIVIYQTIKWKGSQVLSDRRGRALPQGSANGLSKAASANARATFELAMSRVPSWCQRASSARAWVLEPASVKYAGSAPTLVCGVVQKFSSTDEYSSGNYSLSCHRCRKRYERIDVRCHKRCEVNLG
jgi:hypothetical protein